MDFEVATYGVPFDIFTSCQFGEVETVKDYLEAGGDINIRNHSGMTMLMVACRFAQEQIVELLVDFGADLNSIANGKTALTFAVSSGNLKIVQKVTTNEVLNLKDSYEKSPLMYAVEEDQLEIATFLASKEQIDRNHLKIGLQISIRNGFDSLTRLLAPLVINQDNRYERPDTLDEVLEILGLENYKENFEKNKIDLEKLMKLTKEDLIKIGINLLGPRKKLLQFIDSMNK